ncbi:MAG: DUF6434 domain-containing protein [Pseudomonadota bacterium]
MSTDTSDLKPAVDPTMSSDTFARWYWPVAELHAFCDALHISKAGRKSELRARVTAALAGEDVPVAPKRASSKTNWSTVSLTRETLITEDMSFGPNVRGFFKQEIGRKFVCHSDFMDWIRENAGATFADAIVAWQMMEDRKRDPDFRREIASCNNYLQYLRDLRDAHPELTLDQAKECWDAKKMRPARDGFVVYERSDLEFLDPATG